MDTTAYEKNNSTLEPHTQYTRRGMKWQVEEEEQLKVDYVNFRSTKSTDFEAFMLVQVSKLHRAAGGIKARLAMHFPDIPGWDYEQSQQHAVERAKALASKFDTYKDEQLVREYKRYVQNRKETYALFNQRLSKLLGITGVLITARLKELVGSVIKYTQKDIRAIPQIRKAIEPEPVPIIDFSSNPESLEVLRLMEDTRESIFVTGEAGTGKSTLLQYFRKTTKKNVVVLAPTGVASLNVQGQTIHSFCGFGPDITPEKIKKLSNWSPKRRLLANLQTIIIDEISMVRADLLDCVDTFLRVNANSGLPFGGIQMVFIGDLFQLPPVEKDFMPEGGLVTEYRSPYFFDSHSFNATSFTQVRLRTIYRQHDPDFINILSAVRNNVATQNHLQALNRRTEELGAKFTFEQFAVYLTTTNARARQINTFFLEKIPGELKSYRGTALGTFENRELPTDLVLQFKIGSQIMMLNNDRQKRWVNGTMGKIIGVQADNNKNIASTENSKPTHSTEILTYEPIPEFKASEPTDLIIVELETGDTVYVEPYSRELHKFVFNKESRSVETEATGTYTQYPFKLAWAVTIHKAQGKTFNKVFVDLATGTFAHGQLYVALSRCRSLEGLYLRRPITQQDIILDKRVTHFLNNSFVQ